MVGIKKKMAYALFAAGKTPISPEVKMLGLKHSTRHCYYADWKTAGKPAVRMLEGSEELEERVDKLAAVVSKQSKKGGKSVKPTAKKTTLPGGESVGAYGPVPTVPEVAKELAVSMDVPAEPYEEAAKIEDEAGIGGGIEMEGEGHNEETPPSTSKIDFEVGGNHDGKKTIPSTIIGAGLPVSVTLSLKTLSFYEVASTMQKGLTLGDFLDQVAEDFFTGRGRDLGLIKME